MNSWKIIKLGDALKVKSGRNQKAVECKDGKYQILGTGGEIGRTNSYLCDRPSVLIGRKGTIDRPMYKDEPFWTVDTLFYTEIRDAFLPKYIYYLFTTINWRRYNEASGVPSLSASTIESIKVRVPDLEVQQKIVNILDSVNAQEVLLSDIAKKQKRLLRSLIQSSFNKPSCAYKKLHEIAKIERGKTLTEDKANNGSYPVIAGGIYSPYSHDDYTHENVITVSASGANAGYVAYRQGKIWASDCSVVYGKAGVTDTLFIYYYLVNMQRKIYQMQTGGAQPHVHCSDLACLKVPFLSIEEQRRIVVKLKTQEELISNLENYLQSKKEIYKYLLNHLINGDFDLSKIQLEEKDKSC